MRLSAIGLILTLALGFLVAPLCSNAQQPVKLIGILNPGSPPSEAQRQQSPFLQKLRELGWHEGHNLAFERRFAEGKLDRLPDLAADLVRRRLDVIVTGTTAGVLAAKQATTTIPIVINGAGLLVEQGIVASIAHPGGNITGVENDVLGLYSKPLEILKEMLPQVARVALLFTPANPYWTHALPSIETDARALGLQLQPVAVRHPDEFAVAFATIVEHRPDVLYILADSLFDNTHLLQIMDFAATHRLPTLGGDVRQAAEAGSLITFGFSIREIAQRTAVYVDKILKGASPGDLPIERPMKFELIINLKTAQALGITVPASVLIQADEVIR